MRLLWRSSGDAKERHRASLLVGAGCDVRRWGVGGAEDPPLGFVFDPDREPGQAAILYRRGSDTAGIDSTEYRPYADAAVLPEVAAAFRRALHTAGDRLRPTTLGQLELLPVSEDEIVQRLRKNVTAYGPDHVKIELAQVKVKDLRFLAKFAREFKYVQLETAVLPLYPLLGVEYFKPIAARLAHGGLTYFVPPVVELHGSAVVIGGTTRCLWSLTHQVEEIWAIQVSGVREPLPGQSVPGKEVALCCKDLPPTVRTHNFDFNRFRPIERATHPQDEFDGMVVF